MPETEIGCAIDRLGQLRRSNYLYQSRAPATRAKAAAAAEAADDGDDADNLAEQEMATRKRAKLRASDDFIQFLRFRTNFLFYFDSHVLSRV